MKEKPKNPSESKKKPTYQDLGASHHKEDVHAAIKSVDQGLFPSAFCKIIEDVAGDPNYCSLLHADGAGTKSSVAYMMWKETNDLKYFRWIVHDAIVMNTDDLLCVGAIDKYLLSNTIGRNKKLISGEIIGTIIDEYAQFSKKMNSLGLPFIPCGGETADVGDLIRTLILDSTIMTRMKRSDVILPENIRPNDVIVGLSSFGKATYEEDLVYNSGISSNGLTLARHGVLHHKYYDKYPECYSPELDSSLAFFGKYDLLDKLPGTNISIGEAILSPTRTFAPILIPLITQFRSEFHSVFHNTGGGLTKCLKFGQNLHYIKNNLFDLPPFFKLIQESSQTAWEEMYQVFNMGQRMEIVCTEQFAQEKLIPFAQKLNVDAKVIGHIEKSQIPNKNHITIQSSTGTYKYS